MTREYEEDIRSVEDVLLNPEEGDIISSSYWKSLDNTHHDGIFFHDNNWYSCIASDKCNDIAKSWLKAIQNPGTEPEYCSLAFRDLYIISFNQLTIDLYAYRTLSEKR